MAEVMAKSKEHKLRRQMEKDTEEGIRAELDDQFADLRDLLFATKPVPESTKELLDEPSEVAEAALLSISVDPQSSNYDQQVRELAFDKRSKPKDRTKTEEELALEAKEQLEKAERRRQRRMEGLEDSDSEGEGGSGGRKRKRGGDDLEDDFDTEEWGGLGSGLRAAGEGNDDEEDGMDEDASEEGEDSDEDGESEEGSEDDGDSEDAAELEDGDHEELAPAVKKNKGKGKAKSKELPYTFACPETHDEFLEIIEDIEDKDLPIVLQRVRALHHTSLSPDNKFKLQVGSSTKNIRSLLAHDTLLGSCKRARGPHSLCRIGDSS